MISYKLLILNREFRFSLPDLKFKNNSKTKLLVKFSFLFGKLLVAIFPFLLGFSLALKTSIEKESFLFLNLIVFISILVSIFFVQIVFTGKQRFIDPKNFIYILVFALLATSASVFSSNPGVTNTFGITGLRVLSGIFVMLSLLLFYFLNYFFENKIFLKSFTNQIFYWWLAFCLFLIVFGENSSRTLFPNLLFILLGLVLILGKIIFFKTNRLFLVFGLVFSTLFYLGFRDFFIDYKIIIFLLLSLLIFSFFTSFFFWRKKSRELVSLYRDLKENFYLFVKFFRMLAFFLLPLILLIAILWVLIVNKSDFYFIGDGFNRLFLTIKGLLDSSDITKIFFGMGSNSLSVRNSLFENIVNSLGMLGLFAYLFLFLVGIKSAVKAINLSLSGNLKEQNYSLQFLAISFILIIVPIMNIFVYTGLIFFVFWIVALAVISRYEDLERKKNILPENFQTFSFTLFDKNLEKKGVIVKFILLSIFLIIFWIILLGLIPIVSIT